MFSKSTLQAQEQAGGNQGGNDRDEHVAEGADGLLNPVFALHLGFLGLAGGGLGDAQLGDLLIDPVDVPGAEDDLILTGGVEGPLHRVDLSHSLVVRLGPVGHNQAQARGAVGGGADILRSAYRRNDLPRYFRVVVVHSFLLITNKNTLGFAWISVCVCALIP